MAVLDLFSSRQRRLRGQLPDVYTYDALPRPLRVQIVHIWQEAFGAIIKEGYGVTCPVLSAFRNIHRMLAKEFGVFELTNNRHDDAFTAVANYFLECNDVEQALDIIELTFTYLKVMTEGDRFAGRSETSPDDAVAELNERFKRHGVGYAYESDIRKIIRIDSEFVHSEVVKPALAILTKKRFRAASEEFGNAHTHFRERRYQECIADCLKAFESTMKVICATQKWSFKVTDTAKSLIKTCFDHGLIPSYLESQFASLRAALESGVPTVRNRTSGHGQGESYQVIPGYLAAYALHLTATSIVFLTDAEGALRKTNV